ncbi:hypothetical protein CHARACLAT_022405 [Characodon lateralis]|uniref:Uncharacterized protein n=1 Tax=Characodon lateralis TaxID=208331 RepID=A0ABU7EWD2_9TELE|nr:hypothetical protein [Characodon lateralis]
MDPRRPQSKTKTNIQPGWAEGDLEGGQEPKTKQPDQGGRSGPRNGGKSSGGQPGGRPWPTQSLGGRRRRSWRTTKSSSVNVS